MTQKKMFAEDLGIDLPSKKEGALFKWFIASLLFGKPIQQELAQKAFYALEKAGITNPSAILNAGWKNLVKILHRGKYGRFDESTATRLLKIANLLNEKYNGTITNLLKKAHNKQELDVILQEFNGIGPVTSQIFMQGLEKSNILTSLVS